MEGNWKRKIVIEEIVANLLRDAYTSIASVSDGYIRTLVSSFGYTEESARKDLLKLDKEIRDQVADAYNKYKKSKEGESK